MVKDLNPCILRCGNTVKVVTNLYSAKDLVRSRPVGVCMTCGHVQITPLYSKEDHLKINGFWHGHFVKNNPEQNERKHRQTAERLEEYQLTGRMLDVGGGEGWAKKIADAAGMEYHAVEPMEELHAAYEKKGIKISARMISQVTEKYDLIILRHVLEHLLEPVEDLTRLTQCLTPNGFLYIALPDFEELSGKKGYRTSSLRPVHLSYFTMNKLLWVSSRAGLRCLKRGRENELWGIFTKGNSDVEMQNEFQKNTNRLRREVIRNLYSDYRRMLIDSLRGVRKNVVGFQAHKLSL